MRHDCGCQAASVRGARENDGVFRAGKVHSSACAQRTVPPKALVRHSIRQKLSMRSLASSAKRIQASCGPREAAEAIGASACESHLPRGSRALVLLARWVLHSEGRIPDLAKVAAEPG